MPSGPDLNAINWTLAFIPVLLLVVTILGLRWSAPRAGGVAFLAAAGLAMVAFGGTANTTAIAGSKGLSLALFVLAIVWTSVYMYNVVDRVGGIEVIGRAMARVTDDRLAQALLIAWGFSSFIQGITGFGVPVAVAAPLMMMAGFRPARAAAMVLVGHGWAVSFGSMGSSYYTIQLVTGIPGEVIGPHMALLFALLIIVSGLAVAHIHGGLDAVRRGALMILIAGAAMAATMWALAVLGAPQVASAVAGAVGMAAIALLSRTPLLRRERAPEAVSVDAAPVSASSPPGPSADEPPKVDGKPMSFHLGFMPYYLLITLSIISQIAPIKEAVSGLTFGLDYPGFTTGEGFTVAPVANYATIRLLNHPAPLIIFSVLLSMGAFALTGHWKRGVAWESLRLTYGQSISTTVGVGTMVMMAVVMADMGMTTLLAQGIANVSGPVFPLVAPFIGLLGAFMTGSNTNSNVMFGVLQVETAQTLGIGKVTIASIHSIGGSIGSSMAPAKVFLGAAIVGLANRENEVMRIIVPYVVGMVLLAGIEAMVLVKFIPSWTR